MTRHAAGSMRERHVPKSALEAQLDLHLRAEKIPAPVPEFPFLEKRHFRFDRAWPAIHFAVEIEGEVHRIKARFHADIEKYALALLAGWTVLRVDGRSIRSGRAIDWIKAALWERLPSDQGIGDGRIHAPRMSENG